MSTTTTRTWLRRIANAGASLARRLRANLSMRTSLRTRLLPPSLLPRRPFIIPGAESGQTSADATTDALVHQEGRVLRLFSSDLVRIDESYARWIAPLGQLSPFATPTQLAQAIRALPGFEPTGQLHFPLEAYLQALPADAPAGVALAHLCRATRQPSVDFLLALAGQTKQAAHTVEPSTLLLYVSPAAAPPDAAAQPD